MLRTIIIDGGVYDMSGTRPVIVECRLAMEGSFEVQRSRHIDLRTGETLFTQTGDRWDPDTNDSESRSVGVICGDLVVHHERIQRTRNVSSPEQGVDNEPQEHQTGTIVTEASVFARLVDSELVELGRLDGFHMNWIECHDNTVIITSFDEVGSQLNTLLVLRAGVGETFAEAVTRVGAVVATPIAAAAGAAGLASVVGGAGAAGGAGRWCCGRRCHRWWCGWRRRRCERHRRRARRGAGGDGRRATGGTGRRRGR